ncbi:MULTISPECIES: zf-HC2 domain-containing protein [unclassified Frankia]|uniref:zf-HC2 domain-containing protein n=1 Tax=unclassified Frankia TaxID=2632575 RepID=UPI001EF4A13D|nr:MULTISPECIES: zf-HC2 domain-containing protein [unclassified Frankia]
MDCSTCREAVSARLDGESESQPPELIDAHLAGCARCRAWEETAIALGRSLRVDEVSAVPDMVDAVMSAPPARSRGPLSRIALGGVAAIQIIVSLSQLLDGAAAGAEGHGAEGHGAGGHLSPAHLFNESAAWNLALGIGMLWAAMYARHAAGLLPTMFGFVVALTGLSAHDLAVGAAPWSRMITHLPLFAGLALLYLIDRDEHHRGRPVPRWPTGQPATDSEQEPAPERTAQDLRPGRPDRPPLRSVSHHRAA